MDIYDKLERLKKLWDEGVITREEYEREKAKLLTPPEPPKNGTWDLDIDETSFVALMHASQVFSSFIMPLILWILYKEKSQKVNEAGMEILNFEISYTIYTIILFITIIGIIVVPVLLLAVFVMIIIAIIRTLNHEPWKYPFTIRILK